MQGGGAGMDRCQGTAAMGTAAATNQFLSVRVPMCPAPCQPWLLLSRSQPPLPIDAHLAAPCATCCRQRRGLGEGVTRIGWPPMQNGRGGSAPCPQSVRTGCPCPPPARPQSSPAEGALWRWPHLPANGPRRGGETRPRPARVPPQPSAVHTHPHTDGPSTPSPEGLCTCAAAIANGQGKTREFRWGLCSSRLGNSPCGADANILKLCTRWVRASIHAPDWLRECLPGPGTGAR